MHRALKRPAKFFGPVGAKTDKKRIAQTNRPVMAKKNSGGQALLRRASPPEAGKSS